LIPFLLAQLVAPPLQNSPVRLPGTGIESPSPQQKDRDKVPFEVQPGTGTPVEGTPSTPPTPVTPAKPSSPASALPSVTGLTVYRAAQVELILALCAGITDPLERLQACGQALKKRLADDGYLNTRVTLRAEPVPGVIEVEEGRIAAVKVEGSNSRLNRRLARLLRPLHPRLPQLLVVASTSVERVALTAIASRGFQEKMIISNI
jgi:hemolysin activation/secretion protein